jgi:uncharacterized protein YndB with AHSA1/START domain
MTVAWGGSIVIGVTPERLWEVLLDPDADTDWRAPWVRSVRALSDGPIEVGSRYETRYNFYFVVAETATSEITAIDPPHLLAWRMRGSMSDGEGRYLLEPTDGGTRFTIAATHTGRGPTRLLDRAFARHLNRSIAPRQLEALRALATRSSGGGATGR